MNMGYLYLLVAEIPLWLKHMVIDGEMDFAIFKHAASKTTKELTDHFEESMVAAREALKSATDGPVYIESKRAGVVFLKKK